MGGSPTKPPKFLYGNSKISRCPCGTRWAPGSAGKGGARGGENAGSRRTGVRAVSVSAGGRAALARGGGDRPATKELCRAVLSCRTGGAVGDQSGGRAGGVAGAGGERRRPNGVRRRDPSGAGG